MSGALIFVYLAGVGSGLALALAAMWAVARMNGEQMRSRKAPKLDGLEVRDSSMGKFDAAVRGRA